MSAGLKGLEVKEIQLKKTGNVLSIGVGIVIDEQPSTSGESVEELTTDDH